MRYIFFSLRNFEIDVGESVRMYGLLNSLASQGNEVVFISNARRYQMFHPSIKHILIDYNFSHKRRLQGLLALLPYSCVYFRYKKLFHKVKLALESASVGKDPVYFFDYLDNSIGYVLKKAGLISAYVNDIHGITTIEFLNHIANSKNIRSKFLYKIKYHLAYRLDKKVFRSADGLIYGSSNMKKYYEELYGLKKQKTYVIPYVLGEDAVNRKVDEALKSKLQQEWHIASNDFVVLFVGSYKPTAGVDDLIRAFDLLCKDFSDCKLILIGNGPFKESCLNLVHGLDSSRKVRFIEHIPYSQLSTYQSLANVIVCPDKNNLFSQYVIHVKYFDALISGKLVINGSFESVKEVNKDDSLSLSFEPSNVNDLYEKLKLCRENFETLTEKYKETKSFTARNLTYSSYLEKVEILV
jgi:glycosyltransferase involved in cell wall biosynthesis